MPSVVTKKMRIDQGLNEKQRAKYKRDRETGRVVDKSLWLCAYVGDLYYKRLCKIYGIRHE